MKKTVLITGASRGIGRSIALRFAREKYNIVICARDAEKLLKVSNELSELGCEYLSICTDVCNPQNIDSMFEAAGKRFGSIDILVNNAGIAHIGLIQDMSYDEWDNIVNTNLTSVFATCKNAVGSMIKNQSGSIINISSVWGVCGASCEVAYSATKGAINAFTKALAKELAPSNINVNAIACGVIDTEMNSCFSPEEKAGIIEEIPAGRMGTPEEVADLVYAISNGSPYLTGQIIAIDGGYI